jgi:hypothetical protein
MMDTRLYFVTMIVLALFIKELCYQDRYRGKA